MRSGLLLLQRIRSDSCNDLSGCWCCRGEQMSRCGHLMFPEDEVYRRPKTPYPIPSRIPQPLFKYDTPRTPFKVYGLSEFCTPHRVQHELSQRTGIPFHYWRIKTNLDFIQSSCIWNQSIDSFPENTFREPAAHPAFIG